MKQSQSKPLPEGPYISQARRVLTANRLRLKAVEELKDAKRQAAQSMHSNKVLDFDFNHDNQRFNAKLKRKWDKRINVRKLYTALANGSMKLDDFLDIIEAPLDRTREILGDSHANDLTEDYQKPIELVITKKA